VSAVALCKYLTACLLTFSVAVHNKCHSCFYGVVRCVCSEYVVIMDMLFSGIFTWSRRIKERQLTTRTAKTLKVYNLFTTVEHFPLGCMNLLRLLCGSLWDLHRVKLSTKKLKGYMPSIC